MIKVKPDIINYTAIDLLERAGNIQPTQQQIDEVEALIISLADLVSKHSQTLQTFSQAVESRRI